jgi:hypothetical protein
VRGDPRGSSAPSDLGGAGRGGLDSAEQAPILLEYRFDFVYQFIEFLKHERAVAE